MPLESGDFIPELNANNPLGNDPKSEGDDHLRLIKRATLGSFPGFVGTTAVPKSVSLTEDQLNDAAQKSAAENISGAWEFLENLTLDDEKALIGQDSSGFGQFLARMAGLVATFGTTGRDTRIDGSTEIEQRIAGVISAKAVPTADGGLLVADIDNAQKKAGIRNPTRRTFGGGTHAAAQNWEGQVIDFTSATPDINFGVLTTGLSFIMTFSGGAGTKRLLENGTNILWFDGSGGAPTSGARNVTGAAVIQVYYANTVTPYIWGTGLS